MKAVKFFEMSNEELNNKLEELKANLFNLRFKLATNQLPNNMVVADCKRDIARVKTVLRQRELGISFEPEQTKKKSKTSKKK